MKKLLLLIITSMLLTLTVYSVTATWSHSPSVGVTNYRIYWSINKAGPYSNYVQVGYVTNCIINNTNLFKGKTNWFIATALDTNSVPIKESLPTTNECYYVLFDTNSVPTAVKNNHILEYVP